MNHQTCITAIIDSVLLCIFGSVLLCMFGKSIVWIVKPRTLLDKEIDISILGIP